MAKNENIFNRLTSLFRSGPVVKRRVKEYKPSEQNTSAYELFRKTQSNVYSAAMSAYGTYDRMARYSDFQEMEYTPEIASALDIYAEETVSPDEKGNIVHIYSENSQIQKLLNELFYDTLNVNFNMTSWARNMCKYGDFFLFNDVSPEHGVINVFPIAVNEIEREEGFDKNDPLAVRYRWVTQGNQVLQNWQVSHFRILGNDAFLPYGTSVLEAARRIWRQLILIEDSMLVYRIVRSPDRRVFYVDVGNVPPEEIPNYMEQVQSTLKKNQVIDRSTGRVDLRYNPMSVDEDYFLPVRGGQTGTKIENLTGGTNAAAIEDVQYIQKKLFSALKIPKAYLGYDEGLGAKATLSQEDIRFSRSINRIQRTIVSELNKLAIVHLYCNGFEGHDLLDFELKLTNPSTIAQQQKLELYTTKFTIAQTATGIDGLVDKRWIKKNIFMMPDEEIEAIENGLFKDKEMSLKLEAVKLPEQAPEPGAAPPPGGPPPEPGAAPPPGGPAGEESPLGNLDLGTGSQLTAGDTRNPFKLPSIDEDDLAVNLDKIAAIKGLPLRAFAGLTRAPGTPRSLLDETAAGPDYAARERHNARRRKGTKAGMNSDHAAMVGVDKKDPRDSIAHPYGEKKDLVNPLKNAHKVKIDEKDGTEESDVFLESYFNKNLDATETNQQQIDRILKNLRPSISESNTSGEE